MFQHRSCLLSNYGEDKNRVHIMSRKYPHLLISVETNSVTEFSSLVVTFFRDRTRVNVFQNSHAKKKLFLRTSLILERDVPFVPTSNQFNIFVRITRHGDTRFYFVFISVLVVSHFADIQQCSLQKMIGCQSCMIYKYFILNLRHICINNRIRLVDPQA